MTNIPVDILKQLVEAFYSHSEGLPKTSVHFKMKMILAIDYLKSNGVDLPRYDQFKVKKEEHDKASKGS